MGILSLYRDCRVRTGATIAGAGLLLTCGSPPPIQEPRPAAASASSAPETTLPPPAYSRYADPHYLAYDGETNPFSRRTLARLWVLVAQLEAPDQEDHPRRVEAAKALRLAEQAANAVEFPCKMGVQAGYERAVATKQKLEQAYVAASEADNPSERDLALIDAQIHLLRDEVEELDRLSKPCGPFGGR